VDPAITEAEIDYAGGIFLKTYMAMLQNELEATATNYCDPYCRQITDVSLVGSSFVGNVTDEDLTAEGCTAYLEMVFGVDGTYTGCEDTPFPGLFATPNATRRSLLGPETFLRGGFFGYDETNEDRFLQTSDGCGECDAESTGPSSPTTEEMVERMNPYISVIPAVCELTSVDMAEIAK
jgi:hypothetical protein